MARLEARVRNTDKLPLEGVTFLGGEPFEQAEPLSRIAALAGELGLSVITFSGYTLEQLHTSLLPGSGSLLAHTDLLIDGPYVQSLREFRRPWVGSANQRFLFLTDRYSPVDLETVHNQCEIRIAPDGTVSINGMADFTTIWSKLL